MTKAQAMLCAVAAYFLWVLGDTAIKYGGLAAVSPFLIMFLLGSVGASCLVASAFFKGDLSILRPHSPREQAFITVGRVIINYANIIALIHLPLTTFYAVVFTIPLMVAAMSAAMKHETLSLVKIVCLVAGFAGALLAIGIRSGGGDWVGYLAAFTSAACFASGVIAMRKVAKTDSAESVQFMIALSVTVVGLLGILWAHPVSPDLRVIALLVVAGVINIIGGVLYVKAVHNTVSTNVTQFHYTQIISGGILGYLIWNEVPSWNLLAGSVIIIVAGMIVASQAHKHKDDLLYDDER
jgi:drug/metabolite transporter (DMT)-like permease